MLDWINNYFASVRPNACLQFHNVSARLADDLVLVGLMFLTIVC